MMKNTWLSIGLDNYLKSFNEQAKAGSHQFILQREGLLGAFKSLRTKSVIREFKEEDILFCSIPSSLPEHIRVAMQRMFVRSEFLQVAINHSKKNCNFDHVLDRVREEAPLYSSRVTYRLLDYNSTELNFLGRLGSGGSRGCERLIKFHELLARELQILKVFVEEFNIEVIALIPYCRTVDEANYIKKAIQEAVPQVSIGLMVETFMCLENLSSYMPINSAFLGSSDLLADYECIARTDIDYSQFYELNGMRKRATKALTNQFTKINGLGKAVEICTCKDLNNLFVDSSYSFSRTYMPDQLLLSDSEYLRQFGAKALG